MKITSIVNGKGVPSSRGTLLMTETQIQDFCTKNPSGLPLLDVHDFSKVIGRVERWAITKDMQWVYEAIVTDPAAIMKVINGEYIGSSLGVDSLALEDSKDINIIAKKVKEISLTPAPDREEAQIISFEYNGMIHRRRRNNTGKYEIDHSGKALYEIDNYSNFLFFIFPLTSTKKMSQIIVFLFFLKKRIKKQLKR